MQEREVKKRKRGKSEMGEEERKENEGMMEKRCEEGRARRLARKEASREKKRLLRT